MSGLFVVNRTSIADPLIDLFLSDFPMAAYLGIKRDTVYKWIADKRMPAHKVGRLWKFRKEEVDEWVRGGGAGDNEQPAQTDDEER